jgi:hypothetical protein
VGLPKIIRLGEESIPVIRAKDTVFTTHDYRVGMVMGAGQLYHRESELGYCIVIRATREPENPDYEQETLLHELIHLADIEARKVMEQKNECTPENPEGVLVVVPDPLSEQFVEEFGVILYRMLRDSDLWNAHPREGIDQLTFDYEESQ